MQVPCCQAYADAVLRLVASMAIILFCSYLSLRQNTSLTFRLRLRLIGHPFVGTEFVRFIADPYLEEETKP
ncbi:hypothetical protein M514_18960 [Trichuris suis]|uniref:Uncharacterized protein n=1 Tax=Trichuris suis TaxID=68888 RepID=A0A085NHI4_9BILA|nr:hypothetical protein M514_18960 [Trichuris suis]